MHMRMLYALQYTAPCYICKLLCYYFSQKYAFRVSDYPVILSLENHCNETQQVGLVALAALL